MAELKTRKPTGKVAWPLLLVEGEEKAGKSYAIAALTASPRVGRSFLLDLGDGTLDEYAPIGDYELLVTDGTWSSVIDQIEAAAAVPSDPEKPNVIGVDAGTLLWGLQKDRASKRARNSKRARAILADDPDADIDVTMTYWNDVKDDWARLLHVLKRFPGIGIISAQGKMVTRVDAEGRPTREQEWSVDAEKTTPSWVSAWVRLTRDPRQARLVGVRSLHVEVPNGGLVLPSTDTLDHLIFDLLGAGGFGPNTAVLPTIGVPVAQAKGRVLAAVKRAAPNLTEDEAKAEAGRLWKAAELDGKTEVTEAQLSRAMPGAETAPEDPQGGEEDGGEQKPADPPEDPQGGGEARSKVDPPNAQDETVAQQAAAALADQMGATPVVDGPHVTPSGATLTLEGKPVTAEEALDYLARLLKPALVTLASQLEISTAGKVEAIRGRIIEHWGLSSDAPFTAAPKADPPPAEEPVPDPLDELEEVQEIPEGWIEASCLCGEPLMFEKGNVTKTITHLDATLDADHRPEEPF